MARLSGNDIAPLRRPEPQERCRRAPGVDALAKSSGTDRSILPH